MANYILVQCKAVTRVSDQFAVNKQ